MSRYDYVVSQDGDGDFRTLQEAVDAIRRERWWRRLWRSLFGGWVVLCAPVASGVSTYFAVYDRARHRAAESGASPIPFKSASIFFDVSRLATNGQ